MNKKLTSILLLSTVFANAGEFISTDATIFFEEDGIPMHISTGVHSVDIKKKELIQKEEVVNKEDIWLGFESISKEVVGMGEFVRYQLKITNKSEKRMEDAQVHIDLPRGLTYAKNSYRIDQKKSNDIILGSKILILNIEHLNAGDEMMVDFVLQMGIKGNDELTIIASAIAEGFSSNRVTQSIVIENQELMLNSSTIIGKVSMDKKPVENVRIYLEDGTFTLTNNEGKYHFEGIATGTHVVQIDPESLDTNLTVGSCGANSRWAGSMQSQFIESFTGTLHRSDFCLDSVEVDATKDSIDAFIIDDKPETMPDYNKKWLARQNSKIEWVWPFVSSIPSISATNLAVKHHENQTVSFLVNGVKVEGIHIDKILKSGKKALTIYRGVHIKEGDNKIVAIIKEDSRVIKRLERNSHFSTMPVRAEVLEEFSNFVADGKQTPVVAVKFFDKDGYPVRADVIGKFKVSAPYAGYRRLDKLGQNPLSQSTTGEDYVIVKKGIAYIKLEPTTKSGEVKITLPFQERAEELKVWLKPKARDWILVGFAKGSLAHSTIAKHMQKDEFETDGQISLFAKGRVLGSYLLTTSYNNKKGKKELLDTIDPERYYTIYGDEGTRGVEAASIKNLYLKIEKDNFYAMYGDYQTGFDDMELSRYTRVMNGVKGEYRGDTLEFQGFASDSDQSFVRDEISGDGTSGLYRLKNQNIILNSEIVTIETRDRYQSDVVIKTESLTRSLDYNIDYSDGTLYFKKPIFSQDENFNPNTIVVNYELQSQTKSKTGGARGSVKLLDDKLKISGTYIQEDLGVLNSKLASADIRFKVGTVGKLEIEMAKSSSTETQGLSEGIRAEYEHNGKEIYTKVHYKKIDKDFGLSQQSTADTDLEKFGIESHYKTNSYVEAVVEGYRTTTLSTKSQKDVAEVRVEYNDNNIYTEAGYRYSDVDGEKNQQVIVGVGKSFFNNRVTVRGKHEESLSEPNEVFPNRTVAGIDVKVYDENVIFVEHERQEGIESKELSRVGVRVEPWSGGKVQTSMNQEVNDAQRIFSTVGIQQSMKLSEVLSADFSLDRSNTVDGSNTNDFIAYSASFNYNLDNISLNLKGEYKETNEDDAWGISTAMFSETESGLEVMASASYLVSDADNKLLTTKLSTVYRPSFSDYVIFNKLRYIDQRSSGLATRKIVNDFNLNYKASNALGFSVYYGIKDVIDSIDDTEYKGLIGLTGLSMIVDISNTFDTMFYSNMRESYEGGQREYNHGVALGWNFYHNMVATIGYNFEGFEERDFDAGKETKQGVYLDFKVKFE
jgi:uncharacterized repeat protein (TIGR01451 family)